MSRNLHYCKNGDKHDDKRETKIGQMINMFETLLALTTHGVSFKVICARYLYLHVHSA